VSKLSIRKRSKIGSNSGDEFLAASFVLIMKIMKASHVD